MINDIWVFIFGGMDMIKIGAFFGAVFILLRWIFLAVLAIRNNPREKVIDALLKIGIELTSMQTGVSLSKPNDISAATALALNQTASHHFKELCEIIDFDCKCSDENLIKRIQKVHGQIKEKRKSEVGA